MEIEKTVTVAATPAQVWRLLLDAPSIAGCVPGMQSVDVIGPTEYVSVIKVKISFISATFRLNTRIVEQRAPQYMRIEGSGEDASVASSLKQQSEIFLAARPDGRTDLRIRVQMDVLGRLGTFGLSVMKTKADRMWDEFGQNLAARFGGEAVDGAGNEPGNNAPAAVAKARVENAAAAAIPASAAASTAAPVAGSATTAATAVSAVPAVSGGSNTPGGSGVPDIANASGISNTPPLPATPPERPAFAAAPDTALPPTQASADFETRAAGVSRSGWWSRIFSSNVSNPAGADKRIHVELRRGDTLIKADWPAEAAAHCAAWLRDALR